MNCIKPRHSLFLVQDSIFTLLNLTKTGNLRSYLVGFILVFLLGACEDPGIIGLDVQPPDDNLNVSFSDSTTLITYTVIEDSIRTDERGVNLLGSYEDPVFGKASASIYTQFVLPSNNVNFGSGFTPDSLIMTLAFSDYYGDLSSQQTLQVFQLSESINVDSPYYSTRDFAYDPTDLTPNVMISPQSGDADIVVKLNDVIFTFSDSVFADNNAFLSFFKGLYITTDTTTPGSAILYFDLESPLAKLTLYYRNVPKDTCCTTSSFFDFEINDNSARINRFNHDYAGTPIVSSDSILGDALAYAQAMSGVKSKILFPYLKNWTASQKIAVNKAELVVKIENDPTLAGDINVYKPPEKLFLLGIDSAGETFGITDIAEGESYFGGALDATKNEYRFNIARHIQEILSGLRTDYGLYLIVPNSFESSGSAVSANRVVLKGGGSSTTKMKLNLTYTIL